MTDPRDDLLDALVEGVVLIDGGVVTRVNQAAAHMLGTAPTDDDGRPAIAVLRDHRIEALTSAGDTIELTLGGRYLHVERIPAGFVLRDMSDVRRAEEDARALLAVLSHELRTPTTTVRATLEALASYDDLEPTERDRLLTRARLETDRLIRLIEDLTVDVAPPRGRSVSLPPLVQRARALLADRFAQHGIELALNVPDLTVWADPDKALQLLLNLLENAAIHGPEHETVHLVVAEEEGGVTIRVRDVGDALDPVEAEALFAPHARGRGARGSGAGLGLYVVRSIVERSHGRAWVTTWTDEGGSEEQAARTGNEFGIWLPSRPPSNLSGR